MQPSVSLFDTDLDRASDPPPCGKRQRHQPSANYGAVPIVNKTEVPEAVAGHRRLTGADLGTRIRGKRQPEDDNP